MGVGQYWCSKCFKNHRFLQNTLPPSSVFTANKYVYAVFLCGINP